MHACGYVYAYTHVHGYQRRMCGASPYSLMAGSLTEPRASLEAIKSQQGPHLCPISLELQALVTTSNLYMRPGDLN